MTPTKTDTAITANTEKSSVSHDDGLPPDVAAILQEFTGAKYNKLMRKLDMRLIPIVSFFFFAPGCKKMGVGGFAAFVRVD